MKHCGGKTKTGVPCRAPAGPDGLCFFHAHPDLTHTLGQIGGQRNRSQVRESPTLEPLSGANLLNILSEAIREVGSRKMTPRNAAALAQLSNSLHRVLPTADLESRLARIEQQLAEQHCQETANGEPSSSASPSEKQDATVVREDRSRGEDRAEDDSEESPEDRSL